jgi:hypothetical protein
MTICAFPCVSSPGASSASMRSRYVMGPDSQDRWGRTARRQAESIVGLCPLGLRRCASRSLPPEPGPGRPASMDTTASPSSGYRTQRVDPLRASAARPMGRRISMMSSPRCSAPTARRRPRVAAAAPASGMDSDHRHRCDKQKDEEQARRASDMCDLSVHCEKRNNEAFREQRLARGPIVPALAASAASYSHAPAGAAGLCVQAHQAMSSPFLDDDKQAGHCRLQIR